jgi:hypothetical protein
MIYAAAMEEIQYRIRPGGLFISRRQVYGIVAWHIQDIAI